jgi:hypothetical protein
MSDNRNVPGGAGHSGMGKSTAPNAAGGFQHHHPDRSQESCGPPRRVSEIQPHMEVISSCGCTMGKVDHLDGNSIKLTKNDSPDGQHHFVPLTQVERVDDHVHLKTDAEETRQQWQKAAASA